MHTHKKVSELQVSKSLRMLPNATVNGNVTLADGLLYESNSSAITAFAGGGQASATLLVSELNRVTTVATAGDSVKLPAAVVGLTIFVVNKGANQCQVYGLGSDVIDDQAAASGISQMVNSVVLYSCTVAGKWDTEGSATGFGGPGLQTMSFTNGITAFAGGGQGSAVPLTTMMSRVTTVGTAADSVKLPTAVAGMNIVVANAAAANSMNLFPNTGDQINALAANAAFAIAAGKAATLYCMVAGFWHAVLSA